LPGEERAERLLLGLSIGGKATGIPES